MVVETVVRPHVIVEVHATVEVRVPVVRVLHERVAGGIALAGEGSRATDAAVLGAAENTQGRVVVGVVPGAGAGQTVAGPVAAVARGAHCGDDVGFGGRAADDHVVIVEIEL